MQPSSMVIGFDQVRDRYQLHSQSANRNIGWEPSPPLFLQPPQSGAPPHFESNKQTSKQTNKTLLKEHDVQCQLSP